MATLVKRAFKYRFHPSEAQAAEPARTFGCVPRIYNLALASRTEAWTLRQARINYATSAMLTAWKKTDELGYLNEVSSVPSQQALRLLQAEQLPLHLRAWTCRCSRTIHDRDVSAARNSLAEGLSGAAACGAGVRPQRESSRTGRSADVASRLVHGGVLLRVLAGPVVVSLLGIDAEFLPLGA
ncbi:helix-turn-helix domain-containing protein [Micromonospora sp. CPCC 206060]|uniref:helix-turn-helix domain-containing protein n=1 Tax=Micromonospora sp. CPCC 206060 TaxID=3122406 RepID=UPI003FA5FFC6